MSILEVGDHKYRINTISYVERIHSPEDEARAEAEIKAYVRSGCIAPTQRCPNVAVDMLLFYKEKDGTIRVPIGFFNKKKKILTGETVQISGAVISGGHVESGADPKAEGKGDLTVASVAPRELAEEFGITDYLVPLQMVAEFDDLNLDPRNRYLTHFFAGITEQKPQITEEMSMVRLLSLDDLLSALYGDGMILFPDGKRYPFVLGHQYKILTALRLPAVKKMLEPYFNLP